jgi:hypothetical protein
MSKTEVTAVDATLTQAELDALQLRKGELTDAELESIAGGKDVIVNNRRPGGRPGRPFPWPRRR